MGQMRLCWINGLDKSVSKSCPCNVRMTDL
nr:MAG TPA: ENOD40 protein [Caudoviricetes sp.]DAM13909.1 MAG TPA: ENOD40 protein [Caudoviricetes sp.]